MSLKEDPWYLPEPMIIGSKNENKRILFSKFNQEKTTLHFLEDFIQFPSASSLSSSELDNLNDTDIEVESLCQYDGKELKQERILFSLKDHRRIFIYQLLPFKLFVDQVRIAHCEITFFARNSRNSVQTFKLPRTKISFNNQEFFSRAKISQKGNLQNQDYKIRIQLRNKDENNVGSGKGRGVENTGLDSSSKLVILEENLFDYIFFEDELHKVQDNSNWRLECKDFHITYQRNSNVGKFNEFQWILKNENILFPFLSDEKMPKRDFSLKQNCALVSYKDNMILGLSPTFFVKFKKKIPEPLVWSVSENFESEENLSIDSVRIHSLPLSEVKTISPFDFLDLTRAIEDKYLRAGDDLEVLTQCHLIKKEQIKDELSNDQFKNHQQLTSNILFEKSIEELKNENQVFESKAFLKIKEKMIPFFKIFSPSFILNLYYSKLNSNFSKTSHINDTTRIHFQCHFRFTFFPQSTESTAEKHEIKFRLNEKIISSPNIPWVNSIFHYQIDQFSLSRLTSSSNDVNHIPVFHFKPNSLDAEPLQNESSFSPSWWMTDLNSEFRESQNAKDSGELFLEAKPLLEESEALKVSGEKEKSHFSQFLSKSLNISHFYFPVPFDLKTLEGFKQIKNDEKITELRLLCNDFTLGLENSEPRNQGEAHLSHLFLNSNPGERKNSFFSVLSSLKNFNWENFSNHLEGNPSYSIRSFQFCGIFLLFTNQSELENKEPLFMEERKSPNGFLNIPPFDSLKPEIIGFSSPFVIAFPFEIKKPDLKEIHGEDGKFTYAFDFSNSLSKIKKMGVEVKSVCPIPNRSQFSYENEDQDQSSKEMVNKTFWVLDENGKNKLEILELLPMKAFLYENQSISCHFEFTVNREIIDNLAISLSLPKILIRKYLRYNFKISKNDIQFDFSDILSLTSSDWMTKFTRIPTLEISNEKLESENFNVKNQENFRIHFFKFLNQDFTNKIKESAPPSSFASPDNCSLADAKTEGLWQLECDGFHLENIETQLNSNNSEKVDCDFMEEINCLCNEENKDSFEFFRKLNFKIDINSLNEKFLYDFKENKNKKIFQNCRLFLHNQNRVRVISSNFKFKFQPLEAKIELLNPLKNSTSIASIQRTEQKICHYFTNKSYYKNQEFNPPEFIKDFILREVKIQNPYKRPLYFFISKSGIEANIIRHWSNNISPPVSSSASSEAHPVVISLDDENESQEELREINWTQKGDRFFFTLPPNKENLKILVYTSKTPVPSFLRNNLNYLFYENGLYYSLNKPLKIIQLASRQGEDLKMTNTIHEQILIKEGTENFIHGCVSSEFYRSQKVGAR